MKALEIIGRTLDMAVRAHKNGVVVLLTKDVHLICRGLSDRDACFEMGKEAKLTENGHAAMVVFEVGDSDQEHDFIVVDFYQLDDIKKSDALPSLFEVPEILSMSLKALNDGFGAFMVCEDNDLFQEYLAFLNGNSEIVRVADEVKH